MHKYLGALFLYSYQKFGQQVQTILLRTHEWRYLLFITNACEFCKNEHEDCLFSTFCKKIHNLTFRVKK